VFEQILPFYAHFIQLSDEIPQRLASNDSFIASLLEKLGFSNDTYKHKNPKVVFCGLTILLTLLQHAEDTK
jgi:hypothetical protein